MTNKIFEEQAEMKNLYWNNKNNLSRVGYKSFRGLISLLKRVNNSCLKKGYKTKIEIILPIKRR